MFAKIGNLIVASGGLGASLRPGRDPLNAPVVADTSFTPSPPPPDHFMNTIRKYQDYLENPPIDYSTDQSRKILDWATTQRSRVDAAVREMDNNMNDPNFDHARYDDLSDKSCFVGLLIDKAKSNIEGDESLNDEDSQYSA
jgi:hypothetical protein